MEAAGAGGSVWSGQVSRCSLAPVCLQQQILCPFVLMTCTRVPMFPRQGFVGCKSSNVFFSAEKLWETGMLHRSEKYLPACRGF